MLGAVLVVFPGKVASAAPSSFAVHRLRWLRWLLDEGRAIRAEKAQKWRREMAMGKEKRPPKWAFHVEFARH